MLVRLELENFKSYSGHHVIGPLTEFSCIIGPNGAGKSNVMDAISFVLGVKSSQLRSTTLRELVYRAGRMNLDDEGNALAGPATVASGTALPTSCYVMAVILDRDGQEVYFKRSVTSSGASEYRIDDTVVPYSRYNERLEALNIMVKARNFLVFQGDVEAIASQSSRDLTKLIEQVSGSDELKGEYDSLREAQERAAENSTFNFNKKRGILAEMKQCKEQREEAIKFENMLKARDDLLVQHMVWKLYHVQELMNRAAVNIEKCNNSLEQEQETQKSLETDLNDLKRKQAQLQKEALKADKIVSEKQKLINNRGGELLQIEEQMSHLSKKLKTVEDSCLRLKAEKAKVQEEISTLTEQIDAVKAAANILDEQMRQTARDSNKVVLSQDQLHEYSMLREKANALLINEKQQLKDLSRRQTTLTEEMSRVQEKLAEADRRRYKRLEDGKAATDSRARLNDSLVALSYELAGYRKQLDNVSQRRAHILQKEKETEEQLAQIYQELSQARYDERESEHQTRLREALDTMKRVYSGVHGKLIDLCRPSQRKYDVAVSIVLGKHLDAIVVDNSQTAIECIQFLKEQQIGLATFLPLDSLQVKPINEKYRQIAKGARLAIDVLQYDTVIERAVEYSCGNAIVCDTLQIARHVCFDKQQKVKAVTLDGTVIHKAGMITGGTTDSLTTGSRRWERKVLEQISVRKSQLEQQLGDLSHERRKLASDQVLRDTIRDLESKIEMTREDILTAERRAASILSELEFVDNERAQCLGRIAESKNSLEDITAQRTAIETIIHQREGKIFDSFCKSINVSTIDEYETQQLRLHSNENDKKLRFASQISRLENELQFTRDQLAKAEKREESLNKQRFADTAALQKLQSDKDSLVEQNRLAHDEIAKLRKANSSAGGPTNKLGAQVSTLKSMLHTSNQTIDQAIKKLAGLESLLEKLSADRTNIIRRCKLEEITIPLLSGGLYDQSMMETEQGSMSVGATDTAMDTGTINGQEDSLQVDFSQLNDELKENQNPEAVEADFNEQIANVTAEIELMHPNLKANERLDGVEARMKETADEFEKVRKEAKVLRDRFLKVKQQRYDRFNKAYAHISTRIDEIYKELTRSATHPLGGTAYLTLENSEEPYLEGVKYHAMPPMKRFRDMEQLSGGEKTMAALALLFAVHSYHPSPFFVLDEVDAALDNANVAKIARYLRSHAAAVFQFLVISLKSSLYESSNSLVGIYRDLDVKSSAVLTLDLTKYEE